MICTMVLILLTNLIKTYNLQNINCTLAIFLFLHDFLLFPIHACGNVSNIVPMKVKMCAIFLHFPQPV